MKKLDEKTYDYFQKVIHKFDFNDDLPSQILKEAKNDKKLRLIVTDYFNDNVDDCASFIKKHSKSSTTIHATVDVTYSRVDVSIDVHDRDQPVTDVEDYLRKNFSLSYANADNDTEFDIVEYEKQIECYMLPYEIYSDCLNLAV